MSMLYHPRWWSRVGFVVAFFHFITFLTAHSQEGQKKKIYIYIYIYICVCVCVFAAFVQAFWGPAFYIWVSHGTEAN